jgi:hypothetical protein
MISFIILISNCCVTGINDQRIKITVLVGCLVLFTPVFASDEVTLCSPDEEVYFSCPLEGGKIVSACAHSNTAPNKGYVKYRYGVPTKIELECPDINRPPSEAFHYVNATEGSVSSDILKFERGAYTYLITQSFVSHLRVLKNGMPIFRQYCDESSYASLNPKILKGVREKPKSPEDFK